MFAVMNMEAFSEGKQANYQSAFLPVQFTSVHLGFAAP